MGSKQEAIVRSAFEGYAALDRAAMLDHYAEDATWHMVAGKEPFVGRDAIGAEVDRQLAGLSEYTSKILNMASTDTVVFVEGVDTFTLSGKPVTLHWSTAVDINPDGKITEQRDYYDRKELEGSL
jgi:ketosteroid isomerase-like protein